MRHLIRSFRRWRLQRYVDRHITPVAMHQASLCQVDKIRYGFAVMDENGQRVDPRRLR